MLRGIAIAATALGSFIGFESVLSGTVGSTPTSVSAALLLAFIAVPVVMMRLWMPANASSKCPGGSGLYPECLFVVSVLPGEVRVTHPERPTEAVALADLSEVQVLTNDSGPFDADVWWLLLGREVGTGCSFPNGATGASDVLELLQSLSGFKNEVMIQAMGSTSNAHFSCWRAGESVDRELTTRTVRSRPDAD